jgi:hypothetical protein
MSKNVKNESGPRISEQPKLSTSTLLIHIIDQKWNLFFVMFWTLIRLHLVCRRLHTILTGPIVNLSIHLFQGLVRVKQQLNFYRLIAKQLVSILNIRTVRKLHVSDSLCCSLQQKSSNRNFFHFTISTSLFEFLMIKFFSLVFCKHFQQGNKFQSFLWYTVSLYLLFCQ